MAKKLTAEAARRVYLRDREQASRSTGAADANLSNEARLDRLRQYWKKVIRSLPPADRESWLKAAGLIVLGAQRLAKLMADIEAERQLMRDLAPSPAWSENYESTGEKIPALESAIDSLRRERDDRRDFTIVAAVNYRGMALSREPTRIGENEIVRRRLIPGQCAAMEDQLDRMDAIEALGYQKPEYGRSLTVVDACAMGLNEHKRTLKVRGRDPYACGYGTGK